ncbi:hypothetical protein Nepgr_029289 [Nepenthes gracilis]|uniref:DYW domain-containing protein n=1 Tax=Nepenthes gracilis TaxID=150966 RepID=A0AAD3TDW6_NEPGR|nr:hypothetical protein Nepgr_029289 [Nepenthes gracilis]
MHCKERLCISLLQKCRNLKQIEQIQAFVWKNGFKADPVVAGKLILKCAVLIPDSLHHARHLLLHASNPDVFMYNTLSRGLSESETPEDSLITLIEMRRRSLTPDSYSFAFALKVAADLMYLKAGIQLHCQALVYGLNTHLFVGTTLTGMYGECGYLEYARRAFEEMSEPNIVAWNAMLTACFRCDDIKKVEFVFDEMPFRNLTSWNVMLAGYVKAGEVELARKLFMELPMKDGVSWNTMIVGLAQNGHLDEAFGLFRELRRTGMKVNEVSLTGVLSACAQAGALEFGKILHGLVEKAGVGWIVSINNALLDTYARCGNVDMARLVFQRMPDKKNIVTWTSLIAGLAVHGYGEEAIQYFHEMEEYGVMPDGVLFISVLYACSHAGLIKEGCKYFNKMNKVYGIEPTIEHYGCMVDLYGRAGLLQKAYKFINEMPILPNVVIWRTLLGACSFHGNVKLAEQMKQKLSELDPQDSGDYILLSNVYAAAAKWEDVGALRKLMSSHCVKKTPGWSVIEVHRTTFTFVAGGELDEITGQAHEKIREVISRLRIESGYVPETKTVLHDIEEEEKENAVSWHSEKLAVAYGLLRTCKGKTIRIVKNLRICSDCHNVMKLISRVYEVDIVVRDRSRFHYFKDGTCTCKGYW